MMRAWEKETVAVENRREEVAQCIVVDPEVEDTNTSAEDPGGHRRAW